MQKHDTQTALYTQAEQRAMLDVVRTALALSTESIMVWVSIAPHVRGISAFGYLDGLPDNKGKDKPRDFNLNVYLADDEAESLTQLAVMACDLREAVGVKP